MLSSLLRSRLLSVALGAGIAASAATTSSVAQDTYPDRPITIIDAFPPGGGTDAVARAISDIMSVELGQPVVVENRGGANGAIGAQAAAHATPDGYTIFIGNLGTMAITPTLDPKVRYDPLGDFEAVTQINASSTILVVNPALPVNSLQELIDLAKREPGKLNYASSSPATALPMEMFKSMAGIDIVHIPYKGSGPAMTDLLGGHVDVMLGGALATVPHVKSGALRALAVAGSKRSTVLPNVPTIAEQGFPGYVADSWMGLFVPQGTPDAVVAKIHAATIVALKSPAVAKRMESDGAVVVGNSPEEFAAYVSAEHAKWKDAIGKFGGVLSVP